MKKLTLFVFIAVTVFVACKSSKNQKTEPVKLVALTNYFPKIAVPLPDSFNHFVISDSAAFYNQFGIAKTMDNVIIKPDFATQKVLAIQGNPVSVKTIILFDKALIKGKDLNVYYTVTTAEALSYTMTPAAISAIPNNLQLSSVNFYRNNVKVNSISY